MKNFWGSFLGAITGTVLAGIIGAIIIVAGIAAIFASAFSSAKSSGDQAVKKNSILQVTLDYPMADREDYNPFNNLGLGGFEGKSSIGLDEFMASLRYAATDDNIKGIYLDLSAVPSGMATLEEIYESLAEFKKSGKFIYCYSEYLTQKGFYLATVADDIYLNPKGFMEFKGLGTEMLFFKKTLEKLGVEPEVIRPTGNRFKSAVEPFINEKSSDANRLQMETLLNSMWGHMVARISEKTKISVDELNRMANTYSIDNAESALAGKFVKALMYRDEFFDLLKEKTGTDKKEELNFVKIEKYARKIEDKLEKKGKNRIAVIYASGSITGGSGSDGITSDVFVKTLRKAREDEDVKAIVLRVNSPGGDALASELIWREVYLARQVKPMVVSMGNYAASGGYYIACAADTIVADATTLTGSIGVFSVMFNMQKLLNDHIGITTDTVKTHRFADFPTPTRPFTAEEKGIMQRQVDDIYATFLKRVSDGRGLTVAEVDSIAQGRVWTGEDAKKIGLVDVIGGLQTAIKIAAGMAGLEDYGITSLPEDDSPFSELFKEMSGEMQAEIIRNTLDDNYKYYEHIKRAKSLRGPQTRLPYTIDIY